LELHLVQQLVLDEVLTAYTDELRQDPAEKTAAVTLGYTHSLHRLWRTALRMLPVDKDWSVLDVGCGLGILSFELAANLPVCVHGVDIEPRFIFHADKLLGRLQKRSLFAEGAQISFSQGDVRALDIPDNSVDLLVVREVLQFVPDPLEVVAELFRVLEPGGYACVSDTDDQLYITWPPSDAQSRLVGAVTALHRQRGGDRNTGRKLSSYLHRTGFEITATVVLPDAQHRLVDSTDVERALILQQLHAARQRIVDSETMTAEEFDANLAELEAEPAHDEFRMNASIIVLGRKPI
jgi:ubiquinone/menaquinone biosynthesis C-methylase UbiE